MREKNWWIAFILGLLMPGLGHIYIGEMKRALLFHLGFRFAQTAILFLTVILSFNRLINLGVLGLLLACYFGVVFDAVFQIYNKPQNCKESWYTKPHLYLLFYLLFRFMIGGLIVYMTAAHLVRTYFIPSESMLPTLLVGDNILADVYPSFNTCFSI